MRHAKTDGRRIGEEQIGSKSEARPDVVLQQPVSHVHPWAEELGVGSDGLPHDPGVMEDHLQVEGGCHWARRTHMIVRLPGLSTSRPQERLIYRL